MNKKFTVISLRQLHSSQSLEFLKDSLKTLRRDSTASALMTDEVIRLKAATADFQKEMRKHKSRIETEQVKEQRLHVGNTYRALYTIVKGMSICPTDEATRESVEAVAWIMKEHRINPRMEQVDLLASTRQLTELLTTPKLLPHVERLHLRPWVDQILQAGQDFSAAVDKRSRKLYAIGHVHLVEKRLKAEQAYRELIETANAHLRLTEETGIVAFRNSMEKLILHYKETAISNNKRVRTLQKKD